MLPICKSMEEAWTGESLEYGSEPPAELYLRRTEQPVVAQLSLQ